MINCVVLNWLLIWILSIPWLCSFERHENKLFWLSFLCMILYNCTLLQPNNQIMLFSFQLRYMHIVCSCCLFKLLQYYNLDIYASKKIIYIMNKETLYIKWTYKESFKHQRRLQLFKRYYYCSFGTKFSF